MDSQDINNLKRKLKISYVAISVFLVISIGFFFYGLINNIVAMREKEQAIISRINLKECESKSEAMMQQALAAQREAERQRVLALEAMANAKARYKK